MRLFKGRAESLLTDVKTGKCVRLAAISGDSNSQRKLFSLGLLPGTDIRMLSNRKEEPCLILVRGSRLLLGAELAKLITVCDARTRSIS